MALLSFPLSPHIGNISPAYNSYFSVQSVESRWQNKFMKPETWNLQLFPYVRGSPKGEGVRHMKHETRNMKLSPLPFPFTVFSVPSRW